MPKLVCVKCERELRPEKNGFIVVDTFSDHTPCKITEADKWKCPTCGVEIVAGFALGSIEHLETGFRTTLDRIAMGVYGESWCYNYGR